MDEQNTPPRSEYWDTPETLTNLQRFQDLLQSYCERELDGNYVSEEKLRKFIEVVSSEFADQTDPQAYFEKCRQELAICNTVSASYTTKTLAHVTFRTLDAATYQQAFLHASGLKERILGNIGDRKVDFSTE